jgi:hypothetical protein
VDLAHGLTSKKACPTFKLTDALASAKRA